MSSSGNCWQPPGNSMRAIFSSGPLPPQPEAKTSRRWVLGAATLGLGSAVSLASIVTAYYLRHRHRQAA